MVFTVGSLFMLAQNALRCKQVLYIRGHAGLFPLLHRLGILVTHRVPQWEGRCGRGCGCANPALQSRCQEWVRLSRSAARQQEAHCSIMFGSVIHDSPVFKRDDCRDCDYFPLTRPTITVIIHWAGLCVSFLKSWALFVNLAAWYKVFLTKQSLHNLNQDAFVA